MLILINNAYERVASLIMQIDGRWQWNDTNQTDLPSAGVTITSGQQDYELATTHLQVEAIEILSATTNGVWLLMKPIDLENLKEQGIALSNYQTTNGVPTEYDIRGSSIFLYPAPNYTITATSYATAGMRVHFKRPPALYTSAEVTTGTKVPGFNSLYHDLIALWVSYEYAYINGLSNANQIMLEIQRKEKALIDDYSKRNKVERSVMSMKRINYI